MCVQRQTISEGDEVVLSYLAPLFKFYTRTFFLKTSEKGGYAEHKG